MTQWQVEKLPHWGRPLISTYGYAAGLPLWKLIQVLHRTCRIDWRGDRSLLEHPHILCTWHENWVATFVAFHHFERHAWMNHAAWFMKPVHVLMEQAGVERVHFGSTGNDGRAAAQALVASLKEGFSTAVLPDGPAGPARHLRKGVLYMALQSGLPIVPLRLNGTPSLRLPTWDSKWLPLPGSTLTAELRAPLRVTEDNFDDLRKRLTIELG